MNNNKLLSPYITNNRSRYSYRRYIIDDIYQSFFYIESRFYIERRYSNNRDFLCGMVAPQVSVSLGKVFYIGNFKTLEEAKIALDKELISMGYILLSEEKYQKIMLLK